MASPKTWTNVAIAMQSALAAADTITGITKASPGVVTSTAHGLNDGDYVLLTVQGMHQLNGRIFRVANKTADTFELEGEDTTSYDTFSSGTAEAITFGTTLTGVQGLTASGGDYSFIDTTTIHDNVATQIPGTAQPATYTLDMIHDVSDAGQVALKTAADNKAARCFKVTFAGGQIMVFNGYVGFSGLPTGSAQDLVKTPGVITMYGRPTYYAS